MDGWRINDSSGGWRGVKVKVITVIFNSFTFGNFL